MSRLTARSTLVALALAASLLTTGCGRSASGNKDSGGLSGLAAKGDAGSSSGSATTSTAAAVAPGFPVIATKNTTRVPSADPVAIAAAVARAVFPGLTAASRPQAVALVDRHDWRTALAASALMSSPVHAPLLLSDGAALPAASAAALAALAPTGSKPVGNAQVIRIGNVPRPAGRKTTDIAGRDPAALAAAIDATLSAARGKTGDRVIIVGDDPAYAAPAAAYAAKSGDTILFTHRASLPPETRAALELHQQPRIFVLGPTHIISAAVARQLARLGSVTRVSGETPVANAVAFASFATTGFGWGVVDPGHGLVFQRSTADPATAAAASALSASGSYGPLLELTGANAIDSALDTYLKSIEPGYRTDPVRGVYNHGWIVGDAAAITPTLQAEVDSLLEIMPTPSASTAP